MTQVLKISTLSIFLFICLSSIGQLDQTIIKGTVRDASSNEGIPYATIALYENDSKQMIQGTTTDLEGNFTLNTSERNVFLEVTFIGYEKKTIDELNFEDAEINIGDILLNQSSQIIDELKVTAEKSTMEFKLDKRVFNVGKDIASSGQGAMEVLNNVPSVNVDIEGQITVRGNSGAQILIDGKPSVLGDDASNALGTITADMIEKIEVITNPSAKYEAGGTSGIINIVLKKNEKKGINGSVSLNTGWPNNHSLGFSLNKRTEKLNLFTQIGAGYRTLPHYSSNLNQNNLDNSYVEGEGIADKNEKFVNVTLGSDFFINKYNTITLSGNFAYELEQQPGYYDFSIYDESGELVSEYSRIESTIAKNPKYQFDFQYKKQFKNKEDHNLLFSAVGRFFGKQSETDFSNEYSYGVGNDYQQLMNTDFYNSDYNFKLDYVNPLTKNITLETGALYTVSNVGNDYSVYDQVGEEFIVNSNYTNNFLYNQNVLGVYATASYEKKKWGLKLGLRAENTDLTTTLVNTSENNNQNYTNLFPSAHTSYKFSDAFALQAGYSKRIFRPRLWDLNPFFSIQNNYNLRTGNPNLQPEFGDSYELMSIFTFKKVTFNAGVYHLYTTDVVERISNFENNVTISSPQNIGTRNKTGIEVSGKYSPLKWLSINGDFNYGYFVRKGSYEDQDFDFSNDQWSSKFTLKFKVGKSLDFELSPSIQSSVQTLQGTISGFTYLDAGLRQKIWDGKAVINLAVRDVFASRIMESYVNQASFYSYSYSQRGRFITLGFSYSFGKGEAMSYSGGKRFH